MGAIALVSSKGTLKEILGEKGFRDSLQTVASKYMSADRVSKVALLAASRQPRLLQCTASSFLQSVINAAELGLEFGGATGQAYLIPYKSGYLSKQAGRPVYECKFLPGYRGFLELAYRSGHVTFIDAQLVHERDEFDYGYDYGGGGSPFIKHKPYLGSDKGSVICAYSVIMLKDASVPKIDFMSVQELDHIRDCSKSKQDGPWVTFPGEMQKKSIIRRSIKWIRTTPELTAAEEADSVDYDLNVLPAEPEHTLGTDGCKKRLAAIASNQVPASAAQDMDESQDGPTDGAESQEGPTEPEDTVDTGGSWICEHGHVFAAPVDDACPVEGCGSANIEQMGNVDA